MIRRSCTAVVALALIAAALGSCADDPAPSTTVEPTTVGYAPGLTEDLYLPDSEGRAPLVVLVPGGSWQTADPSGFAPLAAALAGDGVAAATAHLRAAQDGVTYPAPVEDVLCAVATAVEEVRRQGLAPEPVTVLGHSSGAHLAALAVLAIDDFSPSCEAPVVRPDALIGLSGPYDIAQVPDLALALLGSSPDDDPATWTAADPVERADLRPHVAVLLLHGEEDTAVPVSFTLQFAEALRAAGHATTVRLVPGADHQTIYAADIAAAPVSSWLLNLQRQRPPGRGHR